jgi:tetrahydromethanopterin S-methyltransferase subunit B
MEAYSVKVEAKVVELEEILDTMENTLSASKQPENESSSNNNEEDIVQKLKTENDCLREVLIRATREEVANLKEDTLKIKPKDSTMTSIKDRLHSHTITSSDSIVPLESTTTSSDAATKEESRKSLKVSHSFIKRQNSTKKILKGKVTKENESQPAGGTVPHKREHSASTTGHRSLTRKDMENMIISGNSVPQTLSDIKLPPLSSLHESKHDGEPSTKTTTPRAESSTLRLPRLSLSIKAIDENSSKAIPLSSRFEKIHNQTTFGPSPPHKGLQRTATISGNSPKWTDGAIPTHVDPHHNPQRDTLQPCSEKDKENMVVNPLPKAPGNKMSLTEVVQKFHDFEKRIVVKEKSMETETTELKKQMDDMKGSLDTLVSAFNHLSQKIIPS